MIYQFGDCELDTERFELRRDGVVQPAEPQVIEILRYFVERQERLITKNELYEVVWQGRIVSESALSSRIKSARRAIGDNGADQRLIRTVHGRGFRFMAPVQVLAEATDAHARDGGAAHHSGDNVVRHPAALPTQYSDVRYAQSSRPLLSAVLSADVHVHALLTGEGLATHGETALLSRRTALGKVTERLGGTLLSKTGGGLSASFGDAAGAMSCAMEIQKSFGKMQCEAGQATAPRMAVTLASDDPAAAMATAGRLQCFAAPGDIVIPRAIEDKVVILATSPAGDGPVAELELCVVRIPGSGGTATPDRAVRSQVRCLVPREPSILVLPFSALGSGDDAAELAEGLRIDIQNALVRISSMLVIAAANASALRGESPEQSARAMGVRNVLHGVVQVAGERARISLELFDAVSRSIVWSEQFDRTLNDTFAVQDEITKEVLAALDVKLLSGEQARIWHSTLGDPKAVRLFYRGVRDFFRMEQDAMATALNCFEAVAEKRPDSPIGFTWTALSHWMNYLKRWGRSLEESKALARQWADQAVAMPDADGQAQTVMAHMHLIDREFDAALAMGEAAISVRPGCVNANAFYANVLHYCGQQDQAIAHVRRAVRLSPIYPAFFANILAAAYLAAEQPEAAMAVGKEVVRFNSRDVQSRLVLTAAAEMTGSSDLAAVFGREVHALDPGFSVRTFCADQPYRDGAVIASWADAWRAAGLND